MCLVSGIHTVLTLPHCWRKAITAERPLLTLADTLSLCRTPSDCPAWCRYVTAPITSAACSGSCYRNATCLRPVTSRRPPSFLRFPCPSFNLQTPPRTVRRVRALPRFQFPGLRKSVPEVCFFRRCLQAVFHPVFHYHCHLVQQLDLCGAVDCTVAVVQALLLILLHLSVVATLVVRSLSLPSAGHHHQVAYQREKERWRQLAGK